jgi:hypothetical protein
MRPLLRETRLLSFAGSRGADRESRRGCTSTEGPAEWITFRRSLCRRIEPGLA